MQNPIGEADLEWILHRNCEGTEQLLLDNNSQLMKAAEDKSALLTEKTET